MFNNTYLIIRIVIAILTFITSGFMIYVIMRYVIVTTYAVENIMNVYEQTLARVNSIDFLIARMNFPIVNSIPYSTIPVDSISSIISRVGSSSSVDIARSVALESGVFNTIHDTITSTHNSPVSSSNHVYPASYVNSVNIYLINPSDTSNPVEIPIHRRVVIVAIIGFGIFVGINSIVGFYLFLATPFAKIILKNIFVFCPCPGKDKRVYFFFFLLVFLISFFVFTRSLFFFFSLTAIKGSYKTYL